MGQDDQYELMSKMASQNRQTYDIAIMGLTHVLLIVFVGFSFIGKLISTTPDMSWVRTALVSYVLTWAYLLVQTRICVWICDQYSQGNKVASWVTDLCEILDAMMVASVSYLAICAYISVTQVLK